MRVRGSLDNKDHIPIYQVATAYRDIEGNDFKEDRPIGAKIKLFRRPQLFLFLDAT